MTQRRTLRAALGLALLSSITMLSASAFATEREEPPAPAAELEPARVNLLVYALYLREKLWDIPLEYAGGAGGVRVHIRPSFALEGACEVLLGRTEAGLSSKLIREQIGFDQAFGVLHLRPSVNAGLTFISRVTKNNDLADVFIGASLRVGPELPITRHDALALDLSLDVGSTSTYGFGLGLRYVRF